MYNIILQGISYVFVCSVFLNYYRMINKYFNKMKKYIIFYFLRIILFKMFKAIPPQVLLLVPNNIFKKKNS